LLENTLQGCVEALVEVLLTNPVAFSRTNRLKEYVAHIATELNLPDRWQFEVAALLSQVGFVTLPSEILNKLFAGQYLDDDERLLLDEHPEVAYRLITKIPRLEHVANMILQQQNFHRKDRESLYS
jgi:HD-GYP domain-containing protein (c-di-GMP phosphodiesterase class II)